MINPTKQHMEKAREIVIEIGSFHHRDDDGVCCATHYSDKGDYYGLPKVSEENCDCGVYKKKLAATYMVAQALADERESCAKRVDEMTDQQKSAL